MILARRGLDAFHDQYRSWYCDRWESLKDLLKHPKKKVLVLNPFCSPEALDRIRESSRDFHDKSIELEVRGTEHSLVPVVDENGLFSHYEMDWASLLCILLAPPRQGKGLDLCSAPGGKALCSIWRNPAFSEFTLNELSLDRRQRLKRVLRQYLPAEILQRLSVTGCDGSVWGLKEKNIYDWILVDAPCSGEGYLLKSLKEMQQWSLKRSKNLSRRQLALLSSAVMAARSGGTIIYSTCSVSPLENEEVIRELCERRIDEVELLQIKSNFGEQSSHGLRLWPDKIEGGPIFMSVLRKR